VLFNELFELRRREPADDIVSHVVAAEGDQVQPDEMLPMCVLLLVAGFEATVNLIGNAVNALLDHAEQWEGAAHRAGGTAATGARRPTGAERSVRGDADRRRQPRPGGVHRPRPVRHPRGWRDQYRAVELSGDRRREVIAAYRARWGTGQVRRLFDQLPDPADHPVFRLDRLS